MDVSDAALVTAWSPDCPQLPVSSSPELAMVIIDRARHHGLRVSGHLPNGLTGREVVDAGFDEIQHLLYARIAVVGFDRLAEMAPRLAALDTASAGWQAFVRMLVDHNVAVPLEAGRGRHGASDPAVPRRAGANSRRSSPRQRAGGSIGRRRTPAAGPRPAGQRKWRSTGASTAALRARPTAPPTAYAAPTAPRIRRVRRGVHAMTPLTARDRSPAPCRSVRRR
jgi:hypothetical protein